MKKIYFILLLILLVTGCQKNNIQKNNINDYGITVKSSDLINKSVESLLLDNIKTQYKGEFQNITITEANNNDKNATFVTFLCDRDKTNYSGILVANYLDQKYELVDLELFKVNSSEKITVNNIIGEMVTNSVKRRFHVVTGYINEPTIDMIFVKYPSNDISGHAIKKGQKTYTVINIGSEDNPESIIAASGETVVFQKDY